MKNEMDKVKGQLSSLQERVDTLESKEIESEVDQLKDHVEAQFDARTTQTQKPDQTIKLYGTYTFSPLILTYSTSAAPKRLPPRFFVDSNFKGAWFEPEEDWDTKDCINLPGYISGKASSVKFGGHYRLSLCPEPECHGDKNSEKWTSCWDILPLFMGLDDFGYLNQFNDVVKSFRLHKYK